MMKLFFQTYVPYWTMAIAMGLPLGIIAYSMSSSLNAPPQLAYVGSFIVVKLALDELKEKLFLRRE